MRGWRAARVYGQLAIFVGATINIISYPMDIQEATDDLLFMFGLKQ
ncbi:hypothetical protein Bphyt_7199 [Paraburkholderia phytofirmans PsJN]|uniref:Uncharacterized protein n=1 Tax=Paraburkholderia phytofirmans (strain DSM 17436 / LMG 22146 / PsJN) TaxID=398527 RepID=B2TAI2_PARPJ|nr:hypothetical protein Bphyt_7199 [Paraburkholderia phytofirmans PsJN]